MDEPDDSPDGLAESPAAALDRYMDLLLRGRGGDVEEFLAAHPELLAAEAARLRKVARALGGLRPSGAAGPLPFERLGPYRLLQRLGAGGMGIVYLAEDERLGRRVALKVVRPELAASSETSARFEREARAVARLNHEHIVTVFEAGRIGDVAFLAMEYIAGQSLDEAFTEARARHGHVPLRDLLHWIRDVARALEAAHTAGVVHRDVKPSNVRINVAGNALLLDFGLALAPDSASLSRTGQVQGTLYYASPEQVSGGGAKVDARTDVWSLGVTLYEGLTGLRPFDGERTEEVLYRIVSKEPIAPRELVPDLARDVETVALKALEKDRERRYASAGAFANDLDALLEGRPVSARPTSAITKAWKWSRRKPAHATSFVLGSLLVVGAPLVFATVQTRHARALQAERDVAAARAVDLEQIAMFQGNAVGGIEPTEMAAHMLRVLEDEARAGWAAAGVQPEVVDERAATLRELLSTANTTNVAVATLRHDVIEPALRTARDKFTERPKVQGMLLHTIGGTCWSLGFVDLALEAQKTAYAVLAEHTPPDDPDRVVAGANLGYYIFASGNAAEAEPYMRASAESLTRLHGADDDRTLNARQNLALVLRALGELDECESIMRDVLAIRRRTKGESGEDTLKSLSTLGALLLVRERPDEAAPMMREAYERRRDTLGPAHEATLTSANNLGVLLRRLEQTAASVEVFREAYGAARAHLGDKHPTTTYLRTGLGETLCASDGTAEAEPLLRESVAISSEVSGPLHPDTLFRVWRHADALIELERAEEALVLLRDVGGRARAESGPDGDHVQRLLAGEVQALTALGRYPEAAASLEAARPAGPVTKALAEAADALFAAWAAGEASPEREAAAERWRAPSR
jgi:tetratricopeptide (TPR) repeat protein/predicted Ser/Thr protein kinase